MLNEMGQDLSTDDSFKDDENAPTADRVQAAISAYFNHQENLRRELEVNYLKKVSNKKTKLRRSKMNYQLSQLIRTRLYKN